MMQDIRWQQRLSSFKKAFAQLEKAVAQDKYSDLEREGLIQRFEYTYELAWNTMKDFLENQGFSNLTGSRDTIKQAIQAGLLSNGDEWMKMITSRILSSHTYNEETAEEIAESIKEDYYQMFDELIKRLEQELNRK